MKHRKPRRTLGEVLEPGSRLAATGLVAGATVAGVVGSASFGSTAAAYSDSSQTHITSVQGGGDPVGTCLSTLGVPILCPIQLFGLSSEPESSGGSLLTTTEKTTTSEPAPAPEPAPTTEPAPEPAPTTEPSPTEETQP